MVGTTSMVDIMFEEYTKNAVHFVGDKVTRVGNFLADKICQKVMRSKVGDTAVYVDTDSRELAGITRDPCSIDEYIDDVNRMAAARNENTAAIRRDTAQLEHRISALYAGVMQSVAAQQHMAEAQSTIDCNLEENPKKRKFSRKSKKKVD